MPCQALSPDDVILPPIPADAGGLPVPQLPDMNITLDPLPIEDLQELYDLVNIILPPGILRPQLSAQYSKNVLDAVLSLLEQFMPVLMLYTFFMPILNMILCIIEILCAINNPFKLVKALIRLFRVCIPEFLALFPFFALILMILSLLLLILTILIYLIQRIIAFIEQIIANIRILAEAIDTADNDSVIAITIKLGDLLCIFQNLFVLLGVIVLIFQVIKRLLDLLFKIPPCDDDDNSGDGCCTPDVCPAFLKNNRVISANTGTLQYYNNVIKTGDTITTMRKASFQFYDGYSSEQLAFDNIIHAYDLPAGTSKIFFPTGETYTSGTTPNSVPYLVDIRFFYDPAKFGRNDSKGARFIRINDCIVLTAPVDGVYNYQNELVSPFNGTLSIGGGTAFEDDGITILRVNSNDTAAGTLETVISLPDTTGPNPSLNPDDGVLYTDVSYSFRINHLILVGKTLITLACHPDVAFNKNFMNATIGAQLNATGEALNNIALPDVQATQDCVINAVNTFRQSVSIESAEQMQTTVIGCLNDLQKQTSKALESVIDAGFDPYGSTFTIDPTIQFTTKNIKVKVNLNESGGNNIANNLPADIAENVAKNIEATISLGEITKFDYDGSNAFTADLTSKISGNGTIKISYNGQFISEITNPTDTALNPSVKVKELLYTFVQSSYLTDGAVRRDEGDVAREGADNGE